MCSFFSEPANQCDYPDEPKESSQANGRRDQVNGYGPYDQIF